MKPDDLIPGTIPMVARAVLLDPPGGDHDEPYQYGYGERITANSTSVFRPQQLANLIVFRGRIRDMRGNHGP